MPATAVSGVYIAHLVRQDTVAGENHITFVVRDDGTKHDIVFQTSDPTWHAYNGWGGHNLYGGRLANDRMAAPTKSVTTGLLPRATVSALSPAPRTLFSVQNLPPSAGWRRTATTFATSPASTRTAIGGAVTQSQGFPVGWT